MIKDYETYRRKFEKVMMRRNLLGDPYAVDKPCVKVTEYHRHSKIEIYLSLEEVALIADVIRGR